VFSSRKLERATYDSVAFCFIAANQHPKGRVKAANPERATGGFGYGVAACDDSGMVWQGNRLDVATALWHHPGRRVLIRWVLVRDAEGGKEPQAFLCTLLNPRRSWAGSSAGGGSRSPSPRFAATSGSSGSARDPPCSACSRWSPSGATGSGVNRAYRWVAGIPKPIQPSATPLFASISGLHQLSQRHRITGTVQKIPIGSSTA
jgi:hypothetical protein